MILPAAQTISTNPTKLRATGPMGYPPECQVSHLRSELVKRGLFIAWLKVVKPYYQCVRCGNCCRWPGLVRLTEGDIRAISGYLKMGEEEFIQEHTRLRPSREGLALKEREDGSCVFLEGVNVCAIQEVKPVQCQGFPNVWTFEGWREKCEAIEMPAKPQI